MQELCRPSHPSAPARSASYHPLRSFTTVPCLIRASIRETVQQGYEIQEYSGEHM